MTIMKAGSKMCLLYYHLLWLYFWWRACMSLSVCLGLYMVSSCLWTWLLGTVFLKKNSASNNCFDKIIIKIKLNVANPAWNIDWTNKAGELGKLRRVGGWCGRISAFLVLTSLCLMKMRDKCMSYTEVTTGDFGLYLLTDFVLQRPHGCCGT